MPGKRNDRLHRSLAERAGAHDDGAPVVLQRAGDDLGCGRRAAIDEHDERQVLGQIAGLGVEALHVLRPPRPGGDDLALIEEGVRHLDRLTQQAAGVVAQVEHDAQQLAPQLLLDLLHRQLQAVRGLLAERCDPQIADLAFGAPAHRPDLDHRAGDGDVERLAPDAADGEHDVGVHLAAHALHRLGEAEPLHRLAVEMGNQIGRLDAGAEGRRVVDRRDHLDEAALHGDLDPQAAELAARLHLHVAEAFRVHVARMGIERDEHTVDRRLDQLLVRDLVHIIGADALENVAEQVELPVGFRRVGLCAHRQREQRKAKRGARRDE